MKKRQIVYVILFICVLALNFVMPQYLPFMMMWIMLLIPAAMYFYGMVIKKNISVAFYVRDKSTVRGLSVDYEIKVRNSFVFAVDELSVSVACRYKNLSKPQEKIHRLELQSLEMFTIEDRYKILYSGVHKFYISDITFYDPLRLFRFRLKCTDVYEVDVMPVLTMPDQYIFMSGIDEISECFEFSDNKPGDEPAEIFDVRKYHGGDSLNRIHWKLSARKDELLVKEFSFPVSKDNCILLELKNCNDNDARKRLEGICELAYAVMNLAVLKEKTIDILYYEDGLVKQSVSTIEECEAMAAAITGVSTYEDKKAWDAYVAEFELQYKKIFYITDEIDDGIIEYLNIPRDSRFSVFCISNDKTMGEMMDFVGGIVSYINDNEIDKSLSMVLL